MPLVILSVGKDESLLHSRNAILRAAGYVVVGETSFRRAQVSFYVGDYDAVVLCHSVDAGCAVKFANEVHDRSPSTPVMQVIAFSTDEILPGIISVESEPQKMIASLRGLIHPEASHPRGISQQQTSIPENRHARNS